MECLPLRKRRRQSNIRQFVQPIGSRFASAFAERDERPAPRTQIKENEKCADSGKSFK